MNCHIVKQMLISVYKYMCHTCTLEDLTNRALAAPDQLYNDIRLMIVGGDVNSSKSILKDKLKALSLDVNMP